MAQITLQLPGHLFSFLTVSVQLTSKIGDTAITTRTTQCSDVTTKGRYKKHISSRNRWKFIQVRHLLNVSSNGAIWGKSTVIHVKYMSGIAISTSRTAHGTNNKQYYTTWHHQTVLDVNVYMLHHQFFQKQIPSLKNPSLWRRRRITSIHERWWQRL